MITMLLVGWLALLAVSYWGAVAVLKKTALL